MTANVDAMVRAGIQAYRAGKKGEARTLLEKACELDQYNEQAWLWLSAVVDSPEEQRTCLENVLFINPDSEPAKQGLQLLASKTGGTPAPAAAPSAAINPDADPFASLNFTSQSPVTPANNPFTAAVDEDEWDEPPTATSSASAVFKGKETSSKEYDDWVSGLNLKSGDSPVAEPAPTAASPFANPDEIFGKDFFDDADFAAPAPAASSDDEDDSDSFTSGPFSAPKLNMPEPTPPPKPPSVSRKSPGFEGKSTPSKTKAPAKSNAHDTRRMSGGDLFATDEDFDVAMDEPDPSEYFQNIPEEIAPGRLPGVNESLSPGLLIGLIALIVLNLGAVVWLISSFSS